MLNQKDEIALVKRFLHPAPRYTSYPSVGAWGIMGASHYEAALNRLESEAQALSLYIHLPFCERMCTFCACTAIANKNDTIVEHYLTLLLRELEHVAQITGRKRLLQIHLGGGTPTRLSPEQLERLGRTIWKYFDPDPSIEACAEIDPSATTNEHLEALKDIGFNRLSMGVQDFSPEIQEIIGRHQCLNKTEDLFSRARHLDFKSINIDIMYGLPAQTPEHLVHNANKVKALGADRVAIFPYAHVPKLKPQQKSFEQYALPSTYQRYEQFQSARNILQESSYCQIGMDHFALETDELSQALRQGILNRNFQGYTVLEPTALIGLGLSAISDIHGQYFQNAKRLGDYNKQIEEKNNATQRGYSLTPDDLIRREVIQRLMCHLDVSFEQLEQHQRVDALQYFQQELEELKVFAQHNLIVLSEHSIKVSELGRSFLMNIAKIFDAHAFPTSLMAGNGHA
tara:strand:+ start:1414 stop:2781 length:1368 start_codon:yes stop_codon:yes gene_type:complete